MSNHYKPNGIEFYDQRSGRHMILVEGGHYDGWVCYKHPEGHWVTLRKATKDDIQVIHDCGGELTDD